MQTPAARTSFAFGRRLTSWMIDHGRTRSPLQPESLLTLKLSGIDPSGYQGRYGLPGILDQVEHDLAGSNLSARAVWILVGIAVEVLCTSARPSEQFGGFLSLETPGSVVRRALEHTEAERIFLDEVGTLLAKLARVDYYGKQNVAADLAKYVSEVADACSVGSQRGSHTEEIHVEPLSIITAISSGLSLVDKFVDLVKKYRAKDVTPHRVQATQVNDALEIRSEGRVVEHVAASQLRLNAWDGPRFKALSERVFSQWNQFNAMYGKLPDLAVDEQARIEVRMEGMRKSLCKDFREMLQISEAVLGVPLEDHYTLYSTCEDC